VETAEDRLRGLVDAGIALSSELSLDALLQKLVHAAAGLTQLAKGTTLVAEVPLP
jgi:hypothetical protein